MTYKFYDTCSLLLKADHLWEDESKMVISSITLEELENIKTSSNKDADVKFAARKVVKELDDHYGAYEIVNWRQNWTPEIEANSMVVNNDSKIILCANYFANNHMIDYPKDEIFFVTNDLCCKHLARNFLNIPVESYEEEEYDYDGFADVTLSDEEMTKFYSHQDENLFNLYINEYIIIRDKDKNIVDRLCWVGNGYRRLSYDTFKSDYFGDVKPLKDDVYQMLVADSFSNNQITLVKGPAGSGKTYLSLGFLLHKLERNKIDKIIVFCNTVATKNSAKLGYYPGTRDEKLLDSQIGNLLSSKLGGRMAVERMIQEEKLILLPLSDIRGYDTTGMRAGIYISEAQNLDVDLMKLTLQRIGEDGICIIDGDCKTQVDDVNFAGSRNGMKRTSQVYRGEKIYGEVTLKIIHRSRIAQIAERL